jgi:hypothetical protein
MIVRQKVLCDVSNAFVAGKGSWDRSLATESVSPLATRCILTLYQVWANNQNPSRFVNLNNVAPGNH